MNEIVFSLRVFIKYTQSIEHHIASQYQKLGCHYKNEPS